MKATTYISLFLFVFGICHQRLHAQTWTQINTGISADFEDILWLDDQTGFLCGRITPDMVGAVYRTTNGGQNWIPVLEIQAPYTWANELRFSDDLHGVLATRQNEVYVTSDGGDSWESHAFAGVNFTYEGIDFTSNGTVLLTGWSGEIFRSTDQGQNWNMVHFNGLPYQPMNAIQCSENGVCLASGYPNRVLRSLDDGENWEILTTDYSADCLFDIEWINQDTIVAVGASLGWSIGYFYRSFNGGQTWEETPLPQELGMIDMAYYEGNIWAVGQAESILKSEDFGNSWIIQNQVEESIHQLRSIYITDAGDAYAVGNNGRFYQAESITSTSENLFSPEILISPNPAQHEIHVQIELPKGLADLRLYGLNGQLLWTGLSDSNGAASIPRGNLAPGLYILEIRQENHILGIRKISFQ